jgi:hypothetical protein
MHDFAAAFGCYRGIRKTVKNGIFRRSPTRKEKINFLFIPPSQANGIIRKLLTLSKLKYKYLTTIGFGIPSRSDIL